MSALGATLRIARRDAARARGRSLLVVAMIALPVMGVVAIDVVRTTFDLTPEQRAVRLLGQADAAVRDTGLPALRQLAVDGGYTDQGGTREGPAPDPASVLPAGTRLLADVSLDAVVSTEQARVLVQLRSLAYSDPLAAGIYLPSLGRAPQRADEVALTTGLADRLGIGLGDTVSTQPVAGPLTVVGVVQDGTRRSALTVLLADGALPPTEAGQVGNATRRLLADVPGQLDWSQVQTANASGFVLEARGEVPGAPAVSLVQQRIDAEAAAVVGLVVGMALLEVVLLAGPAFAVGAKRSRRQLALIAASGGSRRDIRRTVLAGGLVLGGAGAVLGALLGVALGAVAVPLFSRYDGSVPGPFEVRPAALVGIALIGVGTALLAALLPAVTASRQDVVAALTGRRGTVRSSTGVPVAGLLAAVAGAAIAFEGARRRELYVILAGSVIAELGLVALTPALVGGVGRLAPLLPVSGRLALRDAARNRSRTAPAVSAILAAVAGTVAVGTFLVSLETRSERSYTASGVEGVAQVNVYGQGREQLAQVSAALTRELPVESVLTARALEFFVDGVDLGYVELPVAPGAQECARGRCLYGLQSGSLSGPLVGDGQLLAALTGVDDDRLARVLADGGLVAPAPYVSDGMATVRVLAPQDGPVRELRLVAAALPADAVQLTVLSSAAAELVGLPVVESGLVVSTTRMPTDREQDRAASAVAALAPESAVYVERGYDSEFGVVLLALMAGSAVLVLGASGIATGLAAADGRADLSTLASVGATPGLRRRLAGGQSLVTAGLGTALGVVAGIVPAFGLIRALNAPLFGQRQLDPFPFVLPWGLLVVVAVIVPCVAALAAVLLTRSRLPLVRRLA